jgi:hypothetical protein
VEWPAYTAASDEWLDLGAPVQVKPHFRKQVLDAVDLFFRVRFGIAGN